MGLFQTIREDAGFNAFVNVNDTLGQGITSTNIAGKQGLDVNVISSMTVGVADESSFSYGVSTFLPVGGVYNTAITALTAGQSGAHSLTAFRDQRVNLRNSSGTEIGNVSTSPVFTSDSNLIPASGSAITNPSFGLTTGVILAANPLRKGYSIYNPTVVQAFVADAATSSLTLYSKPIGPHLLYEPQAVPGRIYQGPISAIAAATGTFFVTEYV